jgi:hypothetical protein
LIRQQQRRTQQRSQRFSSGNPAQEGCHKDVVWIRRSGCKQSVPLCELTGAGAGWGSIQLKEHCRDEPPPASQSMATKSVVVDRDHFSHVGDSDDQETLEASGFVNAAEEGVPGGFFVVALGGDDGHLANVEAE